MMKIRVVEMEKLTELRNFRLIIIYITQFNNLFDVSINNFVA